MACVIVLTPPPLHRGEGCVGWARQLVGTRCAVGNQVVARVNELHTGVPECPIEHPGYKSG